MPRSLRFIPLGGLGEIGKNMMAIESSNDIIVIDAGVLFPDQDMLGVDLIIPNISYLKENKNRIKGILVTHGHEDHIGALPYILRELNVPVYAPRLARGLIEAKLKQHPSIPGISLETAEPGKTIKLGDFQAEFFTVAHSIPDAMGIALKTPMGLVIHTGDFKIDYTPADGKPTDLTKLAKLSSDGVFLLLSDSTYSEVEGYTASEQIVGEALDHAIGNAHGRVMIATFASLISRVQQILDAAERHDRKVAFSGRSMVSNVKMALRMGYLHDNMETICALKDLQSIPNDKSVIVTTGSQGEPTSALVRIASQNHREIRVIPGDTIIISATPIPGNENLVSRTIDNLFRQGASVLYDKIALVHVHGHASREELKTILNITKPRFFVPIHGQYRHLKAHASLAQTMGIPADQTFVLEDGEVLELNDRQGKIVNRVKAGPVYVSGQVLYESLKDIPWNRSPQEQHDTVIIALNKDTISGKIVTPINVHVNGSSELNQYVGMVKDYAYATLEYTYNNNDVLGETSYFIENIRNWTSNLIFQKIGRRPTIIPFVMDDSNG